MAGVNSTNIDAIDTLSASLAQARGVLQMVFDSGCLDALQAPAPRNALWAVDALLPQAEGAIPGLHKPVAAMQV
jgi:hypothetical protein